MTNDETNSYSCLKHEQMEKAQPFPVNPWSIGKLHWPKKKKFWDTYDSVILLDSFQLAANDLIKANPYFHSKKKKKKRISSQQS